MFMFFILQKHEMWRALVQDAKKRRVTCDIKANDNLSKYLKIQNQDGYVNKSSAWKK